MKEKDLKVTALYDLYAPLFSEKKREAFEMYYFEDLSLKEISEHTGTTRQGIRDLIVRTGEELHAYEASLGLYEKEMARERGALVLRAVADRIEEAFPEEARILRETAGQKGE